MLHQILATLRAPRTYAGLLIGASLAVSGVLMQGLTRNPLASPSILGINAGAACFMALASIGVPFFSQLNPIINAVFGALLSGGAVMLLGGFFFRAFSPIAFGAGRHCHQCAADRVNSCVGNFGG